MSREPHKAAAIETRCETGKPMKTSRHAMRIFPWRLFRATALMAVVLSAVPLAQCREGAPPNPDAVANVPPYRDPDRPIAERVDDLVGRMTLDEKIAQLCNEAPAIERLGLPQYDHWNEGLHGVARAGLATVFPQAIGMAATWNADLIHRIGDAVGDECRAKHHEAARHGVRGQYAGLTLFCPNINIFRDPRWGRGQETYGEDPCLTARLAVQYIRGLQGSAPRYLKTIATAKHFAAHSGPEATRDSFNAVVSLRDLAMTYLPAFKACVIEGNVASVMGSYNRLNGVPTCASHLLLQTILRKQWGFNGYVVSDCGAVADIYEQHHLAQSHAEAAAMALKNGCDLICGCTCKFLPAKDGQPSAVEQGLLTEKDIDRALKRVMAARFRLGMFDPPERVAYARIPMSVVDCPEHRRLALEAARQSLVLLKNQDNLLPLDRASLKSIAVIGPNADETAVLLGNYNGTPAKPVSVLAGVRSLAGDQIKVHYAKGCEIVGDSEKGFPAAIAAAKQSQVAVVVVGLSQQLEGEAGQEEGNPQGVHSKGDRTSLDLPPIQQKLVERVVATGTPVVMVLIGGSEVSVNWADKHVPAILDAWYPGQAGGTAVAEALFGLTNPGGRLPVTFYRSVADLPAYDNYSMENRTYRYFQGDPLYRFGHGLSYTTFAYRKLQIHPETVQAGQPVSIEAEVENTGPREGDEVVQLYLKDVEASQPVPQVQLQGFSRIHLKPGEKRTVRFNVTAEQMSFADEHGKWRLEPGEFAVWIGGQQPDLKAVRQPANVVGGRFRIEPSRVVKSELIFEKAPFRECHASTIVESRDRLVAAWFGGTAEGCPDVGIWLSVLENGRGWSTPIEVVKGEIAGKPSPCWNPVLFQPTDGPLMLFYKIGPCVAKWRGMLTTSDDSGRTWSKPRTLPDGILGAIKNKPIQLANGDILCPSSTEDHGWRVHFERTADLGQTWTIDRPSRVGPGIEAIQPAILRHGDGRLQAVGRTRQGKLFHVESTDGGRRWGNLTLLDVTIPDSGVDALTLSDGRHLLVYNPTAKGRSPLGIAISTDGRSWWPALVLENEPGEYSYPAVIQTSDGLVHVTYTWRRERIKHVVLDPRKLN